MTNHLAAQGSGRLRGRIAAAKRWRGETPSDLQHALGVAIAAERLAASLDSVALTPTDLDFLHRRLDELAGSHT